MQENEDAHPRILCAIHRSVLRYSTLMRRGIQAEHRVRIFWKRFEGSADPATSKVHPSLAQDLGKTFKDISDL